MARTAAARRCGAVALGALVASCTPTITANPGPTAGSASQTVDSTGGTVSASDGTSVVIPPQALTTPVTITIDLVPDALRPDGVTVLGTPHVFGPQTLFNAPVCVMLTYEVEQLPPGVSEKDVVIWGAIPGGQYLPLPTYGVDATHVMTPRTTFSLTTALGYGRGQHEVVTDAGAPTCTAPPDAGDAGEAGDDGGAGEGGDDGGAAGD